MKIVINLTIISYLREAISALVIYLENTIYLDRDYVEYTNIVDGLNRAFGPEASSYFINSLMVADPQQSLQPTNLEPKFIAVAIKLMCYFYSNSNYKKHISVVSALKTALRTQLKLANDSLCGSSTLEVFTLAIHEFVYYICRLPNEATGHQLAKLHTHLAECWEKLSAHLTELDLNISSNCANIPSCCLYWLLEIFIKWIDNFLLNERDLPQDVREHFETSRELMRELYNFYKDYVFAYQVVIRHLFRYQDGICTDLLDETAHNSLYKISLKARDLRIGMKAFTGANNIRFIKHTKVGTSGSIPMGTSVAKSRALTAEQNAENVTLADRFTDSFTGNALAAIGTNCILRLVLTGLSKSAHIFKTIFLLFSNVDNKKENMLYKLRSGIDLDIENRDEYKRECWFDLFLMLLQIIHGHRQTGESYSIVDGSEVFNYIEEILSYLRIFDLSTLSTAYLEKEAGYYKFFTRSGYSLLILNMPSMERSNTLNANNPQAMQLIEDVASTVVTKATARDSAHCNKLSDLVRTSKVIEFLFSQFVVMRDYETFNCACVINQIRMYYELFKDDSLVLSNPLICNKVQQVLSERSEDCISKPIASALFQMIYSFSKSADCDFLLLEYLFRLLCAIILYNRKFLWTGEAEDVNDVDEAEECDDNDEDDEDGEDDEDDENDEAEMAEQMNKLKNAKTKFLIELFKQVKANITNKHCDFFKGILNISTVLSAHNAMSTK